MRTVAVVPMNRLSLAKSRLADSIDPESRRALALWMGERVLREIQASGVVARTAVVSPDPQALAWARALGVEALHQTEGRLNAGLEIGRSWSRSVGADTLLVLFGDLPLLTAEDVRALASSVEQTKSGACVGLAPDRAERGTNGLALRPPSALPFLFGTDSFHRHIEAARQAGLETWTVRRLGASFDVDTPADLDELRSRELWTPSRCEAAATTPGGGR